ncbi:MAG: hypothetical protein PUE85_00075 [Firmicutes bacterium]|nr:hypothetical protein [Bacillota bacterium]
MPRYTQTIRKNIASCALFCITLVPEGNSPVEKAKILCEKFDLFCDRLAKDGLKCGTLVQATIGHGWQLDEMFPFQAYTNPAASKQGRPAGLLPGRCGNLSAHRNSSGRLARLRSV